MWRLAPGQRLACRGWDDEFVLYNDLSGDTHLLDGDSVALLEALRCAPSDRASLCAVFGAGLSTEEAATLPATIDAMLAHLHALYLVAPC